MANLKQRTPDHELWSIYVNDPVGFVYNVLGAMPQEWQANALNMIAAGVSYRNAIKSCHGPGKTALLAWCIPWWLCTRPFPRVACTAPTEHQLHDKLWPELHHWHRTSKAELWRWFEWEKTRYFLREASEEWFAVARVARVVKNTGATEGEAPGMQGFHAKHMLFLVDEASGVDDAVYGAIEGAMSTDSEVKVIAAGNPNNAKGWFYEAFNKQKDNWDRMTVSYRDSPNVSNKWAQDMIDMFGIDHPWVKVKVLGQFPDTLEHGLFGYTDISNAQSRTLKRDPKASKVLGVDVARYGNNRSMVALAIGGIVQSLKAYQGLDTRELGLEVEYTAKMLDVDYVVVDADGVGAGTADHLRDALRSSDIKLVEWHGSANAMEQDRFVNVRTELNWKIKEQLVEEKISLPTSEALLRQGSAIRYDFDTKGRIRLERKEIVAKLIGESPDELDASAYALVPFIYGSDLPKVAKTVLRAEDVFF